MEMKDRIKERRRAMDMRQEDLAEKLGLKKSAIAKYENGRVENIKRSTIQKMAEILECSPCYLLGLEDAPLNLPSQRVASVESKMSGKEIRLVKAYRDADTGIQTAVDKLLDIEGKPHLLPIAAHDDGATLEQINEDKELLQ